MHLVADLHVHSHYSRASSRDSNLVGLYRAARLKGIQLVGTGDFTHPGWRAALADDLVAAEDGLLRLRPQLERQAGDGLPAGCGGLVRFVLQAELSCVFRWEGRTRKTHLLVFVPTLDAAERLSLALTPHGNLAVDGRPTLGLPARDLLEVVLQTDPQAFVVPAHIWTPWFSLFGSRSGFDSISECFGDLMPHIFAVETGLSSDPAMNWRWSELDHLTLISNSDAHSPAKLGREANVLDIDLGYDALLSALRTGNGFEQTLEFFPEEGKYHHDGHRRCGICLPPEATRALGGRCPKCGGLLTVGVLSRIDELADREPGVRPGNRPGFTSLISLAEVVSEICGRGVRSVRVRTSIERLQERFGSELGILRDVPKEELAEFAGAELAEAMDRVRMGKVRVEPGFDGQFGRVRVFAPGELAPPNRSRRKAKVSG